MILFEALRQILNAFEQDKSEFDEVSNKIIQKYYHVDVDSNSKCFLSIMEQVMFGICGEKIFYYQYLEDSTNTFYIDDIANNDLEYCILKYGKVLLEKI